MKKILIILSAVLVALSFTACNNSDEYEFINGSGTPSVENDKKELASDETAEDSTPQKETKEEIDALAAQALEKLSVVPEYPEGYPTLEDVVAQYERANMAIGWIVGTETAANNANDTYTVNGMTYCRVLPDCYLGVENAGKNPDADKLIYNKETLQAYFATLIHPDEAQEYVIDITESFEVPKFVQNEAGALYVLPYAFSAEGYGKENTYELKSNDDGSYTLTVRYTTVDKKGETVDEYNYNVKYVKYDGRWVFENFIVVKQH